mgnify:CR=1 FL=1
MVDLSLLLFICLVLPMLMMLAVFKDESRTLMLYMVLGIFACLVAGSVNGLILSESNFDYYYMTINITPIVEEILKALPILYLAFVFKPKRQHLLECAIAVGIGFAMLENAYIFAENSSSITLIWAIIRGLGAGMMHSICTLAVGYGISLFGIRKKWFASGTVALLATAMIYHAFYNLLIQSQNMYLGLLWTVITFILIVVVGGKERDKLEKKENKKA